MADSTKMEEVAVWTAGQEEVQALMINVAANVDIVASDWNNRMRDVVTRLTSKIPQVGAVVSIIIGIFWPQNRVNIFEAIKADIMSLVKHEILEYELNLHQSEIDALRHIMARYKAAQTNEKGHFLTNWITEADKLSIIFRQSNNNIHLILPTITLALLHLTGLRERLDFGKELYHEDNTKQWQADLEEMYKTYIVDFLPDIFKMWRDWRANQVQISAWTKVHPTAIPPFFRIESYATVVDTITGETKRFSVDLTESTTIFAGICEAHKSRITNDAAADMAGYITTTFTFHELLPDSRNFPKYDKEVFGQMFRGPYSQDLYGEKREFGLGNPIPVFRIRPDHNDYSPNSGLITKVIIREWNTIDAMQFIYVNHQGRLAGNSQGGQRHEIDVTGKPINGLHMGFSNGLLTHVQIVYDDGTLSPRYGNRSGWNTHDVSAKAPPAYRLSSWSFKVDGGPSNTSGPSVIQLQYAPQML